MSFSSYFNHDIQLERFKSRDSKGQPTYAAPIAIKGRYEPKTKLIVDSTGKQIVSMGMVMTEAAIKLEDRITYQGTTFSVKTVSPISDVVGKFSHWEAIL